MNPDTCFIINTSNTSITEISENLFDLMITYDDSSSLISQVQIHSNYGMYMLFSYDNYEFPRLHLVRQYPRDFEPECESD